jgi:hypothetical protein
MHRPFRAITFASIVVGTVLVTSGITFAAATPSTLTTHVTETVPFAPPPGCTGSGGFVDLDYHLTSHTTALADGRTRVHNTLAGTFDARPFVGPTAAGRFAVTSSQTIVGTSYTEHLVFMTNGRTPSGDHQVFHFVAEITIDLATGATTFDLIQVNCP